MNIVLMFFLTIVTTAQIFFHYSFMGEFQRFDNPFSSLWSKIYNETLPMEDYTSSVNCWSGKVYTLSWITLREWTGTGANYVTPKLFIPYTQTASGITSYNTWFDSYSWSVANCLTDLETSYSTGWFDHYEISSSWTILNFGSWSNLYLWKNILNEDTLKLE